MPKRKAAAVTELDLADLRPDPENVRRHTPRNIGVIGDLLQDVGAWRSIAIDEDNTVVAGNGVLEAAAERGFKRVLVVDGDGETLVAVRRRGLSPEKKRKAALGDNRATDLSAFDEEALAALAKADPEALAWGWSEDELAVIVKATSSPESFPEIDESISIEHRCPKCGYEWSGAASSSKCEIED